MYLEFIDINIQNRGFDQTKNLFQVVPALD